MTLTAWILLALTGAVLAGCIAYALPARRLNEAPVYELDTDDLTEHVGRHRLPGQETTKLRDYPAHPRK